MFGAQLKFAIFMSFGSNLQHDVSWLDVAAGQLSADTADLLGKGRILDFWRP